MNKEADKFEEVVRLWTNLYFNQKMTAMQKRLYDWWVSEGFFYASAFKETQTGTRAELMLVLGERADSLIAENELSKFNINDKIDEKKNNGWDMIPFLKKYFVLRDTKANRSRIKILLAENIRYFSIEKFTTGIIGNEEVLKSVVINIIKKGAEE